jgi:hypothetical protein
MSTTFITHRPHPLIAAAAAVAAFAVGSLAVSVSHHQGQPATPAPQPQTVAHSTTPHQQPFLRTTSGGRVLLGE